ncbi:hypothetical protein C7S15_8543 [Burkholderia cepacia]|nr:hypothetical protein [Burkholderia cepacia]
MPADSQNKLQRDARARYAHGHEFTREIASVRRRWHRRTAFTRRFTATRAR